MLCFRGDDGWQLRARATVRPDAHRGSWPVSYDCGGSFDEGADSYQDNIIVYAAMR